MNDYDLDDKQAIDDLPKLMQCALDIIDAYAKYPVVESRALDDAFRELVINMTELESRPKLLDISKSRYRLPFSLSEVADEIDMSYRFVRPELVEYHALLMMDQRRYVTHEDMFNMSENREVSHAISVARSELERFAAQKIEYIDKLAELRNQQSIATRSDSSRTETSQVPVLKLEPRSYDRASGVLIFAGTRIVISRQKNRNGKQLESKEARLMRALFKSVNSMRNGIPYRAVASVPGGKLSTEDKKKVKNYIAQINKKAQLVTGDMSNGHLILFNQEKIMINSFYL